jgi:hypothetical protein
MSALQFQTDQSYFSIDPEGSSSALFYPFLDYVSGLFLDAIVTMMSKCLAGIPHRNATFHHDEVVAIARV